MWEKQLTWVSLLTAVVWSSEAIRTSESWENDSHLCLSSRQFVSLFFNFICIHAFGTWRTCLLVILRCCLFHECMFCVCKCSATLCASHTCCFSTFGPGPELIKLKSWSHLWWGQSVPSSDSLCWPTACYFSRHHPPCSDCMICCLIP